MRRLLVPVLLLILAPTLVLAQVETDRAEQWHANLDALVDELPDRHVDAFFSVDEAVWRAAAAELHEAIPQLEDEVILVRMMALVATIGDGHTRLVWQPDAESPLFPTQFQKFADGIYLVATAEPYADALRQRLIAVDGTPVETVMEQLFTIVSHDNPHAAELGALRYLPLAELLYGLGVIDSLDSATFTFADEDGITTEVTIDTLTNSALSGVEWAIGIAPEDVPFTLERRNPNTYWHTYRPENELLFIKYNQAAEAESYPFAEFLADVQATAEAEPVEKVVIDLRSNGGGNSAIIQPMLDWLRASEFNQEGRLFVLTSPQTFSSAVLNALDFRDNTAALLVGRPTGGKPNHYGEVRSFELPHFNLIVTYSTRFFFYTFDFRDAVYPDILVEPEASAYFAGRDPVLEAVLDY